MNSVISILKSVNAIFTHDHFVGTSGKHFDTYINKDALYPHTRETSMIAELFAQAHKHLDIDVVVAPALGGIILSTWTAHHLSVLTGKDVLGVYAEKKDGTLALTRGYDELVRGKQILAIEDLTTTGGSLKSVVDVVRNAGGDVIATSVMVNKNPDITSDFFGVPFTPLAELTVETFDAHNCPLCEKNIPVNTKIGHGKKFVSMQ